MRMDKQTSISEWTVGECPYKINASVRALPANRTWFSVTYLQGVFGWWKLQRSPWRQLGQNLHRSNGWCVSASEPVMGNREQLLSVPIQQWVGDAMSLIPVLRRRYSRDLTGLRPAVSRGSITSESSSFKSSSKTRFIKAWAPSRVTTKRVSTLLPCGSAG